MQIGIDSFAAAISDPATGLTLSPVERMHHLLEEIALAGQAPKCTARLRNPRDSSGAHCPERAECHSVARVMNQALQRDGRLERSTRMWLSMRKVPRIFPTVTL
jgi:hypothetical protein